MKEKIITGRLENWYFDGTFLHGELFDDVRNRWHKGTHVRTSTVCHPDVLMQTGDTIQTKNSLYLLGKKAAYFPIRRIEG